MDLSGFPVVILLEIYIFVYGGASNNCLADYMNHGNGFASYPYQDVGPSDFMVSEETTSPALNMFSTGHSGSVHSCRQRFER